MFDQRPPGRIVAVQPLVAQQGAPIRDGEPGEDQRPDRAVLGPERPHLWGLLTARDDEAAPVWYLPKLSEQAAISLAAGTVVAGTAAGLEHGLEVIQDQQATGVGQQLKQPSYLGGFR